jgi:hypothetical protein
MAKKILVQSDSDLTDDFKQKPKKEAASKGFSIDANELVNAIDD